MPKHISAGRFTPVSEKTPPAEAWLVMEKGAAKRFSGKPYESRASLSLKPFFDIEVRYHFRREDFHPAPSVDIVLLRLKRKETPDIPAGMRREYEAFLDRQFSRFSRLPRESGNMLYVQWLCLFRCNVGLARVVDIC